jgi:hypothetical protein
MRKERKELICVTTIAPQLRLSGELYLSGVHAKILTRDSGHTVKTQRYKNSTVSLWLSRYAS